METSLLQANKSPDGKEAKRKEYAEECKLVGIECNWEKIFRLKGILVNKYKNLKEKELQTI